MFNTDKNRYKDKIDSIVKNRERYKEVREEVKVSN
jgi:hypothetical protein